MARARRIAAGAGAVALAAGCMAGTAQATFPGENGEIAFNRDGELWAASGLGEHLLAGPDGRYSPGAPAYSADGGTVVFTQCCGLGHGSLRYVDADGGNLRNPGIEGKDPVLSPDGTRVAFVSTISRDPRGLYTTRLDGSDPLFLGDFATPDWSPDGATIAATVTTGSSNRDIVAVPAAGGTPERLTTSAEEDLAPSWSPDGARIAYEKEIDDRVHIAVMDADGGGEEVLTEGYAPTWSPDGKKILFNRFLEDVGNRAWVMNADGSGGRVVLNAFAGAWQPLYEELPLPSVEGEPEPGEPEPPAGNRTPRCKTVARTPKRLAWRPNGKMRPIRFTGGRDPDGDAVTVRVLWVGQDERVMGRGDRTAPDATWTRDPRTVLVRNERSRHGDGRVYYVDFALTDRWGARCIGTRTVRVRRHKRKPAVASRFYASSVAVPILPSS
jgi:TolB protein